MAVIDYLEEDETNAPARATLFSRMQEDILDGKLMRGSHLTEESVCKRYNVSRTPVREALSLLEADGLVKSEKNRGAFVVGFDKNTIDDILSMKEYSERLAVILSIDRITKEELSDLDELFEFMEFYTMKDDVSRMININQAFHKIIYHSTHDLILERMLNLYELYITRLMPDDYTRPGYLKDVLSEHRAIYEAIKMGSKEAAIKAIADHTEGKKKRRISLT